MYFMIFVYFLKEQHVEMTCIANVFLQLVVVLIVAERPEVR
jgi:hypothetical protein